MKGRRRWRWRWRRKALLLKIPSLFVVWKEQSRNTYRWNPQILLLLVLLLLHFFGFPPQAREEKRKEERQNIGPVLHQLEGAGAAGGEDTPLGPISRRRHICIN